MLAAVIKLAKREWRTILAVFLAVSLVAVVAAFALPKRYEGAVLVNYASEDTTGGLSSLAGEFGGLATLAGINLSSTTVQRTEAIATLGSRQFSGAFIEKHGLLPVLFPDLWDAAAKKWTAAPDDVPTMSDAFDAVDSDMRKITDDKSTGLITVSIRDRAPEHVAAGANARGSEADRPLREPALRDSRFTIAFLEKELNGTDVFEVRQAIARVLEAEINKATLANGRAEYAFRVVDPAVRPDVDDFVWPNRPLIVALGLVLGLGLGFAYVLLREDVARGD